MVGNISSSIPCPVFGLKRPSDSSDEMIVSNVELEANALLGAYNWKEHKGFLECCSHGSHINWSFHEMVIKYESREASSEPQKRGRASGNIGSTEPVAKKGRKDVTSVPRGSSFLAALARPPRNPSVKLSTKQAEIQKKKDAEANLHKALDAPLRMVSLVDDNSDEDVAEVPPKVDTDLTKTSKEARPGVALETVMECVPKEDEDRGAMVEDMQLSGKHITQDFMELDFKKSLELRRIWDGVSWAHHRFFVLKGFDSETYSDSER
ncbi:uncharacterized protein LOC112899622 [Panicum hallii]|uniref:uncharacterized protein LOC112899622 n=1 Tax=Panicum hallii TaxID=206008 RepID=UPI000DF4EBFC|nr:uncharacterized protein LOC112899622 [Panicum hallii]